MDQQVGVTRVELWNTPRIVAALVVALGLTLGCSSPPRPTRAVPAPTAVVAAPQPVGTAPIDVPPLPGGYRFTLNGKPYEPDRLSLHGNEDEPSPGDLVRIDHFYLPIGTAGHYVYETSPCNAHLYQIGADGSRWLVAVQVRRCPEEHCNPKCRGVDNALAKLTAADLRSLRSIWVSEVDQAIDAELRRLDLQGRCVTIRVRAENAPDAARVMDALSPNVMCLQVSHLGESPRPEAWGRFRALTYLGLDWHSDRVSPFDVQLVKDATALRFIDFGHHEVANVELLAGLEELVELELPRSSGVSTVDAAASLQHLRKLNVNGSEVRALMPVAHLPKLQIVDASRTDIDSLPAVRMAALKELRVMSTRLTDDAVADFAKLNPQTTIWHRYGAAVQRALRDVDRVGIFHGPSRHRRDPDCAPLGKGLSSAEVRELIDGIDVKEDPKWLSGCMCEGGPTFDFYRGDEFAVSFNLHHAARLEWPDGWSGQWPLTDESAKFLVHWLAERGMGEPLKEWVPPPADAPK